ncbi:MAG: twin-arginine translocation signal domain-containing protein, partial [Candidatus Eisenbacteria bacterium]|nr:twin-arginine translocation signal domain-containing protein [Candidatus Eisenbacteria bacterium]
MREQLRDGQPEPQQCSGRRGFLKRAALAAAGAAFASAEARGLR